MTIIRLITNNYLQTLCSLSSSCGGSRLNIALQNPLPSPTRTSLTPSRYILLLPSSLSAPPPTPTSCLFICVARCFLNIPLLFSFFLSTERLTIPLASRLIYHPNGGYRRVEKTPSNLPRETEPQRDAGGKEMGVWIATVVQVQPASGFVYMTRPLFDS